MANDMVKVHKPQKAHLHPLRDVCVQYGTNPPPPPMGLRDLLRKRNADRRTDGRTSEATPILPPQLLIVFSRTSSIAYLIPSIISLFS